MIQGTEVQPVTCRNVHLVQILLVVLVMNLVGIALVVAYVTTTLVSVDAFPDFSEQDANIKQLYFKCQLYYKFDGKVTFTLLQGSGSLEKCLLEAG